MPSTFKGDVEGGLLSSLELQAKMKAKWYNVSSLLQATEVQERSYVLRTKDY